MVGHDAPRVQVVALAVEMEKGVQDVAGDLGMAQRATPQAGIQPGFDFLSFSRFATIFGQGAEFVCQHAEFFLRQTIGEAVGDRLEQMRFVAMREVATRVPFFGGCADEDVGVPGDGDGMPGSADVPVGF